MSHCISIYLIRKSELRNDKISSLIGERKYGVPIKINWIELDEGILATTYIQNIKNFGKDKTIANIHTNYFGGIGDQSAKLFINNKLVFEGQDEYKYKYNKYCNQPINEILKLMGVNKKKGMDEFDTIGLGKYRSNEDFQK